MRRGASLLMPALLLALAVPAAVGPAHELDLPDGPPAGGGSAGHVDCRDGFAGIFPCARVDLLAHVPLVELPGGFGNDLWGWADPETGAEIAILGLTSSVSFVDVTDPTSPVLLGSVFARTAGSFWGDFKTYADHVFIVTEADGQGLEVFDLRRLRDVPNPPAAFERDAHYTGFSTAHNIAIDEETGFAYVVGSDTCRGGLHVLDVREPKVPRFVACYDRHGYVHDSQCVVYRGPDVEHVGREICLNANEDHLAIVDVTDKQDMRELSVSTYTGSAYVHQGWLTHDQRWFLLGDESDEEVFGHGARTYLWDVSDLDRPVLVSRYTSSSPASDHNLYVMGEHVYQANYRSGLRILRLGDLAEGELAEVGFFDTFPSDDAPGFVGAWSVYPWLPSGRIVVSDIAFGLFVLEFHAEQAPRCTDGLDNDADGLVDFDDPLCSENWPYWEAPPCGLGTELALLLPAWPLWRRKRSAQRAGGERSPSRKRSAQRAGGERSPSGRRSRPSC